MGSQSSEISCIEITYNVFKFGLTVWRKKTDLGRRPTSFIIVLLMLLWWLLMLVVCVCVYGSIVYFPGLGVVGFQNFVKKLSIKATNLFFNH